MAEILIGIAFIVLASKVGPALAHRISAGADSDIVRRVRDMDARLAETEDRMAALATESNERLVDLEERVDFTERVIQQQRERGQIPPVH